MTDGGALILLQSLRIAISLEMRPRNFLPTVTNFTFSRNISTRSLYILNESVRLQNLPKIITEVYFSLMLLNSGCYRTFYI